MLPMNLLAGPDPLTPDTLRSLNALPPGATAIRAGFAVTLGASSPPVPDDGAALPISGNGLPPDVEAALAAVIDTGAAPDSAEAPDTAVPDIEFPGIPLTPASPGQASPSMGQAQQTGQAQPTMGQAQQTETPAPGITGRGPVVPQDDAVTLPLPGQIERAEPRPGYDPATVARLSSAASERRPFTGLFPVDFAGATTSETKTTAATDATVQRLAETLGVPAAKLEAALERLDARQRAEALTRLEALAARAPMRDAADVAGLARMLSSPPATAAAAASMTNEAPSARPALPASGELPADATSEARRTGRQTPDSAWRALGIGSPSAPPDPSTRPIDGPVHPATEWLRSEAVQKPAPGGYQVHAPQTSPDSAGTQVARPVVQTLSTPVADPAWGEQLNERVLMLANNRQQQAELRLSPAELGPLRIRLTVEDGAAHVAFTASHAATRDAIEQALPRLKLLLEENGLDLGQTSVDQQARDDASGTDRDGDDQLAGLVGDDDGLEKDRHEARAPEVQRLSRGLLDTFA